MASRSACARCFPANFMEGSGAAEGWLPAMTFAHPYAGTSLHGEHINFFAAVEPWVALELIHRLEPLVVNGEL